MKIISFYSENNCRMQSFLSAKNKLDYIIETFVTIGEKVCLLSLCCSSFSGKYSSNTTHVNNSFKIVYPKAFPRKTIFQKLRHYFFDKWTIYWFLNKNISNGETVYLYHSSTYHKVLKKIIKKKKVKVLLEVEEIYGDVLENKKLKNKELSFFNYANAFIFPTEFLNRLVNIQQKPYLVIHGSYKVEDKNIEKFNDGRIHCVYSGTFDPRKGSLLCIYSALYLNDRYHLHIIGFGNEKEKNFLLTEIKKIQEKTDCIVTYDGMLMGEDYVSFLQRCDIGLSTQDPNATFNGTSFPSKILSYMANGLRVVTIKLPTIEESAIGRKVLYYNEQTPKSLSETIKNVNLCDGYDSKKIIKLLDMNFQKDLRLLLDSISYD